MCIRDSSWPCVANAKLVLSFSTYALRCSVFALFNSFRHFFHEKPNCLNVFLTVSRQQLRPWCVWIHCINRFNVQRGSITDSTARCGATAAASKRLLITVPMSVMIFSQKGVGFRPFVCITNFLNLPHYTDAPMTSPFGDSVLCGDSPQMVSLLPKSSRNL